LIPQIGIHNNLLWWKERILQLAKDERETQIIASFKKGATQTSDLGERYDRIIEKTEETSTWAFRFAAATPTILGAAIPLSAAVIEAIIEILV
jgi:hypothetical protein